MNYEHTQIGYYILLAFIAVSFLFGSILIQTGFHVPVVIFMLFILFLLASFGSLQVLVDEQYVRIKFGYGIYRKEFLLQDIASAKTVRNHWYYGWGIRGWLWPRMWIYTVSGLDAVEITMKQGAIYRIGTDEPEKLEAAILRSMNQK